MRGVGGSTRAEDIPEDAIGAVRTRLLDWYSREGRGFPWREQSASCYEIAISEILLQRTSARAVAGTINSFLEEFPSWGALANAAVGEIGQVIKPLGLWRRRSKRLKALGTAMVERDGELPSTRQELEQLPGVGQYIANAILLLCFDEVEPLLDSNMARVLERIFEERELRDIRDDPFLQQLSRRLIGEEEPVKLNFAILDLGGTICRPRSPKCDECPLSQNCSYFEQEFVQ